MDDTSVPVETEDDVRWRTDIINAIMQDQWEDAEFLLLTRQGRIAEAEMRLFREREAAIEAWKRRFQDLSNEEYVRLVWDVQQTTFGYVKSTIVESQLARLRRFLNTFINALVKLATALLFAAIAAIAHQFVGAKIDRALNTWLWQYIALVVFILAYKAAEKPLEGFLDKGGAAIRRWGLHAEAERAYVKGIMIEGEIASIREFGKRAT
jgi:hypothetical protein